MTDNGSCYRSRGFAATCQQLGETALGEWAYARLYRNSEERAHALTAWLHRYN